MTLSSGRHYVIFCTIIFVVVLVLNHDSLEANSQQFVGVNNNKIVINNNCGAGLAGYLLADSTDQRLKPKDSDVDSVLAKLLDENVPDMRPLRDFTDFHDLTPNVAKRAWQLMHQHALKTSRDKVQYMTPIIEEALISANVTVECKNAASKTLLAVQNLDSWAIQLVSAWGNFPPIGIYEGTFGDIGSYHGCVNVPQNTIIGHAHYCTISYRPVLPGRKNYDLIVSKEPDDLLQIFDRQRQDLNTLNHHQQPQPSSDEDAFKELLINAQYNHYIYYKLGTCFPIQCNPFDVQKLAKLLGRRSILMSGPVKCHSKFSQDYELDSSASSSNETSLKISTHDLNDGIYIWKPHFTETQLVALLIVSSITILIISLTIVDIILNRIPKFRGLWMDQKSPTICSHQQVLKPVRKNTSNGRIHIETADCNGNVDGHVLSVKSQQLHNNNDNQIDLVQLNQKTCDTNNNPVGKLETVANRCLNSQPHERNDSANDFPVAVDDVDHQLGQKSRRESTNYIFAGNDCGHRREQQGHRLSQTFVEVLGKISGGSNDFDGFERKRRKKSLFMEIVDDFSIISNFGQFIQVGKNQLKNDILCINGIRCFTMSWIIITHTMQYNDWSAFARTREIESHFKSLISQPLFNGTYLVDTFFLMSGLLTSFTSFKSLINSNDGSLLVSKFSLRSFMIGRYLRLTPQIMFVSMLFILLPQLSQSRGPHWYTMTGEYSENCSKNWWVNLFHIQAFYRTSEMCNFVCWWVSIDMFYHLFALAIILIILYCYQHYDHRQNHQNHNHHRQDIRKKKLLHDKILLASCVIIVVVSMAFQAIRHYQLALPPNLLSTIPQTGAMWSKMTLDFFWQPFAHAFPYFLGFYIGYLMAYENSMLTKWFKTSKRIHLWWILAACALTTVSYSTYFWVVGKWQYSRLVSTIFYLTCPIVWAASFSWAILACHYGRGGWINEILSCRLFVVLGKASYIVYLSHFLVLFSFFGGQNLLLEPTQMMMTYVIMGNICLSMLFGSSLSVIYEMPWLKTQKRLMSYIR